MYLDTTLVPLCLCSCCTFPFPGSSYSALNPQLTGRLSPTLHANAAACALQSLGSLYSCRPRPPSQWAVIDSMAVSPTTRVGLVA